jgi:hypothetical protein
MKYEIAYSEQSLLRLAKFLAPRYVRAHWCWGGRRGLVIPTEEEIVASLQYLVQDSIKYKKCVSSGGLFADCGDPNRLTIGVDHTLHPEDGKKLIYEGEWSEFSVPYHCRTKRRRMIQI